MNANTESSRIEAARVPEEERMNTLPHHFGRYHLTLEDAVYRWLGELSPDYAGGYWHFYELSSGGFYMAPESESLRIHVDGNGYEGRMGADAAGITACLFALSHLSFRFRDETFGRHFHRLLEYAAEHPEASAIFAATD